MGLTIAQKIIKAHLVEGEMVAGSEIALKIDQTLTQDATGTMAYLELTVFVPKRVWLTLTIIPCSRGLKMLMTTDIFRVFVKNTASIFHVPVTAFAIRYI